MPRTTSQKKKLVAFDEIHYEDVNEEHFQVSVDVVISERFFGWLFGLGTGARIVSSQSAGYSNKLVDLVKHMYSVDHPCCCCGK